MLGNASVAFCAIELFLESTLSLGLKEAPEVVRKKDSGKFGTIFEHVATQQRLQVSICLSAKKTSTDVLHICKLQCFPKSSLKKKPIASRRFN